MPVHVPDRQSDDDLLQEVLTVINEQARKSAGGRPPQAVLAMNLEEIGV